MIKTSILAVLCCLGLFSTTAWSQRAGGKTSDYLPPVTIVVQASSFEDRPDLGGVYDRTRGIVWGYSLLGFSNSNARYGYAMTFGSIYASALRNAGDGKQAEYINLLQTDGIDDGSLLVAAAKLWEAARVAEQYTNWRLPTLTEARDATSRGLFTYGSGGLNKWTGSPADVTFGLPYDGRPTWTSTIGKGKDKAWTFNPKNGEAWLIGMVTGCDAIMVRSYTGP